MKNDIILLFSSEDVLLSLKDISKKLKCDKNELLQYLNELELEGLIYKNNNNMYQTFPQNFFIGKISVSKTGSYRVIINQNKYSIKKDNLNSALGDDTVILKKDSTNNYIVEKILKRNNPQIVCEITLKDGNKTVKPCFLYQDFNITIGSIDIKKRVDGERILVELSTEKYNDSYIGKYLKTIGFRNDPDINLKSIAESNGFSPLFNEKTLLEASTIPSIVTSKDLIGRLDLRKETIFTIDGIHTKDIDDAVSIKKIDNGNFELGVHIAHVSNYVKMQNAIYEEALSRGNSLYMNDTVIPMLPQILSNGICSLNENVDRLARSVIMQIDKTGKVINYRIVKSVINSKKKMNYDDVNKILEENTIPEGYENYVNDLKIMNELSNILNIKRQKEGFIDFASNETEVVYKDDKVDSIEIRKQNSAEKMIENFMIVANCVIAQDYYWKKVPFIYRNHSIPDSSRLLDAIHILKEIGYRLGKINNLENPATVQNILTKLSQKDEFPIISSLLLRSMQKAVYEPQNLGHYGLGVGCYTHFTSPIRRLSDLTIHNIIDLYEDDFPRFEQELDKLESMLPIICQNASIQERRADIAEYQAYKLASIEYMENQIGNSFDAYITDIGPHFIKIRTDNNVDGIINLNKLNIKHKYLNDNKSIVLPDYQTSYLIGSLINVTLKETSTSDLELYFTFSYIKDNTKKRIKN